MKCIYSILVYFLFTFPLFGDDLRLLYQKNTDTPQSSEEIILIEHVKNSFEKAIKHTSKLSGNHFEEVDASKKWRAAFIPHYHTLNEITNHPAYHLLNNLCSFKNASHLHVGLLGGDSLIAALYQNQSLLDQTIGVDWFQECSESIFYANCQQFLNNENMTIINGGCFDVDKSIFKKPIDIYFYDADHSLKGHERAITYYNDIFADVFVVVIDDWNCPWVRGPTFKAFDKLQYTILYENTLMDLNAADHGQYVAVIRKTNNLKGQKQESLQAPLNMELLNLKRQVFHQIQNSWCSYEKAELIMDVIYLTHPDVCVEIGTFTGSSFLPIVSALKFLGHGHAYAIDAWSNDEAVKGIPLVNPHFLWWLDVDMIAVFRLFSESVSDKSLASFHTILPYSSSKAAQELEKIDFLHLDGNFSEKGSLQDVVAYLPKVNSGGYILLSNLFVSFDNHFPKMKSLWMLLEQCEVVAEIDGNQTILFRKN